MNENFIDEQKDGDSWTIHCKSIKHKKQNQRLGSNTAIQ